MPEALTREKAAAHVAAAGNRCPFCGSEDLEPQGYGSRDCGVLDWKIYCNACEETYTELYQLVGLDTDTDDGAVDVQDVVVSLLKQEPIFILLDGGIVQDVGLPQGLAAHMDVVVMDVDTRDFEPAELTEYTRIDADGRARLEEAHFYTPLIWEHTDGGVRVRDEELTDAGLGYQAWQVQQADRDEPTDTQLASSQLQTGPYALEESLDDVE